MALWLSAHSDAANLAPPDGPHNSINHNLISSITRQVDITVIWLRQTSASPEPGLRYDVATIKPSKANSGWKLEPTLDGYTAHGVSLHSLIEEAYGI